VLKQNERIVSLIVQAEIEETTAEGQVKSRRRAPALVIFEVDFLSGQSDQVQTLLLQAQQNERVEG